MLHKASLLRYSTIPNSFSYCASSVTHYAQSGIMLVDVGGDKRRDHSLALLRSAVCQYTVVGAEVPVLSGSLEGGEERGGERRREERGGERSREERGRGEGGRRARE